MPLNKKELVKIVPYQPEWADEFANLAEVLKKYLGNLIMGIEHVGGTSVPGLPAKPIIDLNLVIAREDVLGHVIPRLELLGYKFVGDLGIPQRWAFDRRDEKTPNHGQDRTWLDHHLYVCPEDGRELKRQIFAREFLRNNPEVAEEYGKLKIQLAREYLLDRKGYSEAKTSFLEKILKKRRARLRPGKSKGLKGFLMKGTN